MGYKGKQQTPYDQVDVVVPTPYHQPIQQQQAYRQQPPQQR